MGVMTAQFRRAVWRAAPLVLFVIGIATFNLRYHEFWRDEANAMLVAKAVPWSSLLEAMRVEGIPPLFHILLKIAGSILPNPWALVLVGAIDLAILLWGTYRLLFSISDRRRASFFLTMGFATTYVYAYELGVVIRQYTLGLGLAFVAWAYLRRALQSGQRRDVHLGAFAAGLSALSSAHSACLAGGVLLGFGGLSLWQRRPWQSWRPILWTLPCFALDAYLASPYADRTPDANVLQVVHPGSLLPLTAQLIIEGFMPSDWWRSESFYSFSMQPALAILRNSAFWGVILATFLIVAIRITSQHIDRRPQRLDVLTIFSSLGPLIIIIVYHYWGGYRHHLFCGLPAIVVVAGHAIDTRIHGLIVQRLRQTALVLLVPWFILQALLSFGSFRLDAKHPFSGTKEGAKFPVLHASIVGDADWVSLGMLFWRPDLRYRSMSSKGNPVRYIRPDKQWHTTVPISSILVEECVADPKRVYFVGNAKSLEKLAPCAQPLTVIKSVFDAQPPIGEFFQVMPMDCACVAEKQKPVVGPRFR